MQQARRRYDPLHATLQKDATAMPSYGGPGNFALLESKIGDDCPGKTRIGGDRIGYGYLVDDHPKMPQPTCKGGVNGPVDHIVRPGPIYLRR
jgi:hypothetical protein